MKKKKLNKFIDWILFDNQAMGILLTMGYIMGFIACSLFLILFIYLKFIILIMVFSVLTLLSIRNIWKNRLFIKAFGKNKQDYINITLADTLNSTFKGKKK